MRLPLRSVSISDFRRLEGSWHFPLDAPIVLVHGPNGAGKTSLLSAIELALTGDIRSMRRHDDRYTAHLPTHGSDFATIEIEVSDSGGKLHRAGRLTVGGSRIEGQPALPPVLAQFYAERSYLDQVSLGQLLDLYQYRDGKEESALARFVNELLGLDQLDALQIGLSDTTHVARLRKLSGPFASLGVEIGNADTALSTATSALNVAEGELSDLGRELEQIAAQLELGSSTVDVGPSDISTLVVEITRHLETAANGEQLRLLRQLAEALAGIGGQIRSLSARPAAKQLEQARATLAEVKARYQQWSEAYEAPIAALRSDAIALGLDGDGNLPEQLTGALAAIATKLARHESAESAAKSASADLWELRVAADQLDRETAAAEKSAGSLASGLAALQDHVGDEICPVCDRDFFEVSSGDLATHLRQKIDALANQGKELDALRMRGSEVTAELQRAERQLAAIQSEFLPKDQLAELNAKSESLALLGTRFDGLEEPIAVGRDHRAMLLKAESDVDETDASIAEESLIRAALAEHSVALAKAAPPQNAPLFDTWQGLSDAAARQEEVTADRLNTHKRARRLVESINQVQLRVEELKRSVTDAAGLKLALDEQRMEVDRRRAVARRVHDAAMATREAIVQRVFTESLNDVWADVFSRLAPREPFVPAFGIPKSTKNALELRLETTHPSGEPGGSPSVMLSSGNLNTAALSLFIALHLAVEPLVPCLVFDDPVQSMDEVHIAQFAGLIRVLSKQHERQIVVAVHERELFEYLALELSPAYEGDELITIELGPDRWTGSDDGVNRVTWSPDSAIAI